MNYFDSRGRDMRGAAEQEIEALRGQLRQASDAIKQMTEPPHALVRVLHVRGDKKKKDAERCTSAVVLMGGTLAVMKPLASGPPLLVKDMQLGAYVSTAGGALLEVQSDLPATSGRVVVVSEVCSDTQWEASGGEGSVRLSKIKELKMEKGDRVLVHDVFAIRNLGKAQKSFNVEETNVSWGDIGGQAEAKASLREAIELPYQHAELFKAYGKKQTKGVLLYGPSGTGKTLLAKAAATALATTHGAKHSTGFIYIKGPEVLSKWVGQSEETIRSIFGRARAHKAEHGYPAVIFIDEADALLSARGGSPNGGMNGALTGTIVPMFLAEMDGFEESAAVVLLATNRPETLDPAVVRDGRVDRKVYVGRPSEESARDIFEIHLKHIRLANAQTAAQVARDGARALFDTTRVLYSIKREGSLPTKEFTLGHVASGAMIASMCQQAATRALQRDIEAGVTKPSKVSGVLSADFEAVAQDLFRANVRLNHQEDLERFCQPFQNEVRGIDRARAS